MRVLSYGAAAVRAANGCGFHVSSALAELLTSAAGSAKARLWGGCLVPMRAFGGGGGLGTLAQAS